jgi:hypothetical protein
LGEAAVLVDEPVPHVDIDDAGFVGAAAVQIVQKGNIGTVSRGLASLIEKAVGQWGLPNGYVLGEEAGGAFFGGLRYGEGTLRIL